VIEEAYDFALQVVGEARDLGYEMRPDGAQVFGRVPHVAPLAWLHRVYPPLQEHDIALLEGQLNRPIPSEYRSWLQLGNGFDAFSGAFVLYGRRSDYSRRPTVVQPFDLDLPNVLERLPDANKDAFFIGSVLNAEYLLYVAPATGEVYACGRRSAVSMASWESVHMLVISVMGTLRTAFDGEGRALRLVKLHELTREVLN
jgi:hypothetical protein